LAKDSNGFSEEAKGFYERSVKVWNGLINTYPNSDLQPDLCCWAGDCYRRLGKYKDSLQCFQRVVDKYSTYKYAWHALFMVGCNYENLSKSGLIPKSEADTKIRAAYTQLIEKYPSCPEVDLARNKMNSK
jgi:TolA-binding protein